jgi:hypothetical protein
MPYRQDQDAAGEVTRRATDRVTRFIARTDAHLPTLPDDAARRIFLDRQLDGWERRYARFVASEGCSEPVAVSADPPQAADFLLTIIGLAARRCALDDQGEAMSDESADKPIARAIRSLLVAADQRCPAIIGQAHLLYYARPGATPKDLAEKCAQLERDVDDLRKAIADVDAAMSANAADRN